MVLPSHSVPPDAGWISRELQALRAEMQVLRSTVAGLPAIQSQINFLSGMLALAKSGDSAPTRNQWASPPDNAETWIPFDAALDCEQSVTIPSTGQIFVEVGGVLTASSSAANCASRAMISPEILQGGVSVVAPTSGFGAYLSASEGSYVGASVSGVKEYTLSPGEVFTIRTRRGHFFTGTTGTATSGQSSTWVRVTKIGM